MLPTAYLRVYRPLDTFPSEERAHWERYIVSGSRAPAPRPVYREQFAAPGGRFGLLTSAEGDHADVRFVDGRHWICPWRTRLRVLASMVTLRETAPAEMANVLVSDAEARRAARELARLRRREPSATPPILQCAWHVPVRWFVLVDEGERHVVEAEPGQWRLYYWTPMVRARERAARAREALRRAGLDEVADVAREMSEWLSSFPAYSAVELDYASVSSLFGWDELVEDHSGREIQESIEAVQRPGGMSRAMQLYQQVAMRWADARSRESLN